jgi:hypothetical protein
MTGWMDGWIGEWMDVRTNDGVGKQKEHWNDNFLNSSNSNAIQLLIRESYTCKISHAMYIHILFPCYVRHVHILFPCHVRHVRILCPCYVSSH